MHDDSEKKWWLVGKSTKEWGEIKGEKFSRSVKKMRKRANSRKKKEQKRCKQEQKKNYKHLK